MKTSRIVAMLLTVILTTYLLSIGPATRWMENAPTYQSYTERRIVILDAYSPIIWAMKIQPIRDTVRWYNDIWAPDPRNTPRRQGEK